MGNSNEIGRRERCWSRTYHPFQKPSPLEVVWSGTLCWGNPVASLVGYPMGGGAVTYEFLPAAGYAVIGGGYDTAAYKTFNPC